MQNPDWVRDEVILALDLYVRSGRRQLPPAHAEVIRLSNVLNSLPIHARKVRDANFRNPVGVSMILGNLLHIDPNSDKPGLAQHNRLHEEVWHDYADRAAVLRETAVAIEQFATGGQLAEIASVDDDGEVFVEGHLLSRLHRFRERNAPLIARKKKQFLRERGSLACETCDFDFAQVYGELGEGYAECHHTLPLAQLGGVARTRLSDLAIVCANCHRMLHRSRPVMSVDVLRKLVSARRIYGASGSRTEWPQQYT